jgi:hypothetical protein
MPIDRFIENDPYLQTAISLTADNNQSDLNVIVREYDAIKATTVVFQSQGLTGAVATPAATVSSVAQQTIGAALGGIDQPRGGGGCFTGTSVVTLHDGTYIPFVELHKRRREGLAARSYDEDGRIVPGIIWDVTRRKVYDYVRATFSDDSISELMGEHRFYIPSDNYIPIKYLLGKEVVREDGEWLTVTNLEPIKAPEGVYVYNLAIKDLLNKTEIHNYCADRKRVHNLKPAPEDQ